MWWFIVVMGMIIWCVYEKIQDILEAKKELEAKNTFLAESNRVLIREQSWYLSDKKGITESYIKKIHECDDKMSILRRDWQRESQNNSNLMYRYLEMKRKYTMLRTKLKAELYDQLVKSHNSHKPDLLQIYADQKEEIKRLKREISRLKTGIESSSDSSTVTYQSSIPTPEEVD